jgi:hypothetical protein
VEVGEVRDAEPVELGRHAVQLDLDDPSSQPTGLEPRPARRRRGCGGQEQEEPGQTESFSVTGATETT